MDKIYKKIKRQNGERFARAMRDHHNGLFEIPNIADIVKHAGRDAEPLLPYLMGLMETDADAPPPETGDPFEMLSRAGYDAFYADTLEKQNSIASYFKKGELLCTFNSASRYKLNYIINAVKKDVDSILRDDFNGREERQDEYGTSVISIQILKKGGFISIKNRYNHTVAGCDNTFNSNPDNIIEGLSESLKKYFNVDFTVSKASVPAREYTLVGQNIFKYHTERNNVYYGDQAWIANGEIHEVDKSAGDALFGLFMFRNKTKTLEIIDSNQSDNFAHDFNRDYGGRKNISVQKGNLVLDGETLIGAENSQIVTLDLPELTQMTRFSLFVASALKEIQIPNVKSMGENCLRYTPSLTKLDAPNLEIMGEKSFAGSRNLKSFRAWKLQAMAEGCLQDASSLENVDTPHLKILGDYCFENVQALTGFHAPKLKKMGSRCFRNAPALCSFSAPELAVIGSFCFVESSNLSHFHAPTLEKRPSFIGLRPSGGHPANRTR